MLLGRRAVRIKKHEDRPEKRAKRNQHSDPILLAHLRFFSDALAAR